MWCSMNSKTGVKIRTLPDPKWPKPPVNETVLD